MTVIRPNSISGITSITAQANEINVFKSDGTLAGLSLNGVNVNTTTGISTYAALNVTGNVSVGGTLTYQDVTNVDAVGLITARAGVNVSGGQLDVGSNIKIGNAGVITATSFVGSGANLTGISAGLSNIVEDTSPQLGGNLYLQGNNILAMNNEKIKFGNTGSLEIFNNGSSSVIKDGGSGALTIQNAASEVNMYNTTDNEYLAQFINGGACKLYHDGSRKFETSTDGIAIPVDGYGVKIGANNDVRLYHETNNWSYLAHYNTSGSLGIESVNDISIRNTSGEKYIYCNEDGRIELYHDNSMKAWTQSWGFQTDGHIIPYGNNTHDLGASNERWRNVYTNDLNLSNEGSSNDVDGTWGDFTIQEGESDLFLINKRNGKKYKFNLTEVS